MKHKCEDIFESKIVCLNRKQLWDLADCNKLNIKFPFLAQMLNRDFCSQLAKALCTYNYCHTCFQSTYFAYSKPVVLKPWYRRTLGYPEKLWGCLHFLIFARFNSKFQPGVPLNVLLPGKGAASEKKGWEPNL